MSKTKKLIVREGKKNVEVGLTDIYQRMLDKAVTLAGSPYVRTNTSELKRNLLSVGGNWVFEGYRKYQLETGVARTMTLPAEGVFPKMKIDDCKGVPSEWNKKLDKVMEEIMLIFLQYYAIRMESGMKGVTFEEWYNGWTTTVVSQVAKLAKKHKCRTPSAKRGEKLMGFGF